MSDMAWIHGALTAARPQAVGALLRYFRDMDRAEEAFQEACLRALKNWPENGPPRDPAAWLILVGRNAGLDGARKQARDGAAGGAAGRFDISGGCAAAAVHLLPSRIAGDAADRAGPAHRFRPHGFAS